MLRSIQFNRSGRNIFRQHAAFTSTTAAVTVSQGWVTASATTTTTAAKTTTSATSATTRTTTTSSSRSFRTPGEGEGVVQVFRKKGLEGFSQREK